ncbi:hypothetical protein ABL78_3215 [Leptomonas seymouri]|uniref:Retinoic acid induced 16-like protein n=1 Tax=Leptomonas seymouri TaxID=5684 RepID=A0A0N0P6X3_LEPSE|nr:hypothetical protein ABL78_3215 [Leptomonas seymouri]|eukprot:KPI87677.1 hypothetical protein ABL78_3215 [Leptomonas seymouri]
MDNDVHARFQRMLLGEPELQPKSQPHSEPPLQQPQQQPQLQQSLHQSLNVDANANLTPGGPAVIPPPLSTASKHPPAQPLSMVSIVQDQWLRLCDYFQRVQCANSNEQRIALVHELDTVESSLNCIMDALLTDHKQLVSMQLLQNNQPIFGESFHSELGTAAATPSGPQEGKTAKGAPPSSSVPNARQRDALTAAAATAPLRPLAGGLHPDGALTSLPPCYRFLFADAHHEGPLPFGGSDAGADESRREGSKSRSDAPTLQQQTQADASTHAAKAAESPFDDPSPIGGIFLLTLCQYAKQDEPPGVRSIILEFIVRLLQEADLPTDRTAYPAGDPALSLLQLNPPLLIVPLLDMLRKVSKALDPSGKARHGDVSMPSLLAYPLAGGGEDQDGTFLQDAGRTQFVIFLSSLAEKMERVPALANFFVVEDGKHGERNVFVLLDALLPYLTHDCSAPGWTHRRDTCRYALSAVISLAKCPDPWIQDFIGKEGRVASRTLMAARTTLLTLCKIPDNDDSATQVLFLRDVLRFWASLLTMSPSVAEDLQLATLIEKDFYFQTLIPLLQLPEKHVYSAACLVAAQVLRDLNCSAPVLTRGLAKALLATSIRKASGRIIPHANHYNSVVTGEGGEGKANPDAITLGRQEEAAAERLKIHSTTSFFLYYILPHLSSNPYMSVEERENCALLGSAATRWSAAKATLVLVQALVENVPEVFLREVFLMDVCSLADVLRKQSQSTNSGSASPSGASESSHNNSCKSEGAARAANVGLWSTGLAPPHLKVHEYFVKELHDVTAAGFALGLGAERVGEAVLSRLLRIEGNMSIDALRARQEVMSAMTQLNPKGTISAAADAEEGNASLNATPSSHVSMPGLLSNCWIHAGVQHSPLTVALCEMVQHLDSTPFTVSSLVADLVVSLCLLPDLRVIYTLLDPENGSLKLALRQLRDVLQHKIHMSASIVTLAQTTKKGATATSTSTVGCSSRSGPPLAATASPLAGKRISLLVLYDTLVQHWDVLMHGDELPSNAERSLSVPRDAVREAPSNQPRISGFPIDSLRDAVEANSNVLHACLYSEYLLAHLDAAIGYSALSQNLMYLRTSV